MIDEITKISYGTEFQQKVWQELIKIPFGSVMTYKQIANLIGTPLASRAVANACAKNPYPIIIPCHRVIKSNGNLRGFSASGGIKLKEKLLKFEKAVIN